MGQDFFGLHVLRHDDELGVAALDEVVVISPTAGAREEPGLQPAAAAVGAAMLAVSGAVIMAATRRR